MSIIKRTAAYFARKEFCRTAINECADLSFVREQHTIPVLIGIFLIVVSFLIGLPAVFVVGIIAAWVRKPLIGVIGIPLIYGLSWLLLMLGMYLTGPDYARLLGKWFVKVVLEKILGEEAKRIASTQSLNIENRSAK